MDRRIIFLHSTVVSAAKYIPFSIEQSRADRDPALGCTETSFFYGDVEELLWIDVISHQENFTTKIQRIQSCETALLPLCP